MQVVKVELRILRKKFEEVKGIIEHGSKVTLIGLGNGEWHN